MTWIRRNGLLTLANIIGICAFLLPFLITMSASANNAHAHDAPIWAAVIAVVTLLALASDLNNATLSSTQVALLGVCGGALAVLRLFDLPAGANGMFFLVVIFGAAFGWRFGFYVGLIGVMTSALLTGGLGPWLPFQCLGMAWMGAGAGVLYGKTQRLSLTTRVLLLVLYGIAWGFIYGALLNLWFWPLYQSTGPLAFNPDATMMTNLHHYWSFYLATSAVWDGASAFWNGMLIALTAPVLLRSTARVSHRMEPAVIWQ